MRLPWRTNNVVPAPPSSRAIVNLDRPFAIASASEEYETPLLRCLRAVLLHGLSCGAESLECRVIDGEFRMAIIHPDGASEYDQPPKGANAVYLDYVENTLGISVDRSLVRLELRLNEVKVASGYVVATSNEVYWLFTRIDAPATSFRDAIEKLWDGDAAKSPEVEQPRTHSLTA